MIYLYEDIASVKANYKDIPDDTFMTLIALDPTFKNNNRLGTYGRWILDKYRSGAITEDDFDDVIDALTQFNTYKSRLANKDIGAYKTLDDITSAIIEVEHDTSMLSKRQMQRWLKKVQAGMVKADDDYDVPYEDDRWVVYIPNTQEAAVKLGNGTAWCTSRPSSEYYFQYTENGHKLYIVVDKKDGDKYQFSDKTFEFRDENDDIYGAIDFEGFASSGLIDYLNSVGFEEADSYNDEDMDEPIDETEWDDGWCVNHMADYAEADEHDYILTDYDHNFVAKCGLVDLPDYLTAIGDNALRNFPNDTVIIPPTVFAIREQAFMFSRIKEIKIPDSVHTLEERAFMDCKNLERVYLSSGVHAIQSGTFYNCYSLTDIKFGKDGTLFAICENAFSGCVELKEIRVFNIDYVGTNAFRGCTALETVVLDCSRGGRIKIGAFDYCTSLKEMHIYGVIDEEETGAFITLSTPQPITIWVDSQSRDSIIRIIKTTSMINRDLTVCQSETGEILYTT